MTRAPIIFVIATEESGDRLGGPLMRSLRERLGADLVFVGVGGQMMEGQGLRSLFPVRDLSVIGFAAIAMRLRLILRRIRDAADAVIETAPDVLVIIDSPDFTHRVARRVRRIKPSIPIVNYVSPTVWAWRPGRARAMRNYVNHVLALFPFEPEAHRVLGGPPCTYVGHPIVEQIGTLRPDDREQARRDAEPPVLLVFPGSRRSEVRHYASVFGATLALLREQGVAFDLVLPTVPHVRDVVAQAVADWPVTPRIVVDEHEKRAAFRVARAALAKSGTVTLELAIAGVPMVSAFRARAIETWIARQLVRTASITLPNLVVGENIVPEFIQADCTPDNLATALADVLKDGPARTRQLAGFARLDTIMEIGSRDPSERAAAIVIETMQPRSA